MTIILEASQLALQIHEVRGPCHRLDRILGWEAAFVAPSPPRIAKLSTHKYGSELMNITADATLRRSQIVRLR